MTLSNSQIHIQLSTVSPSVSILIYFDFNPFSLSERHLLNDPHDPFNRSPLTIEEVISRPDIKKQIDDYRNSKMQKK